MRGAIECGGEGKGAGRGAYNSTTGTLGFIHNFLQVYLRRYLLHIYVFKTAMRQRLFTRDVTDAEVEWMTQ